MSRVALSVVTAACLACALLALSGSSARAQDVPPKFKAGVALVPITAVVRDSRGRLVRGLTRDDFEVLEDNQHRAIVEFRATDHAPVSLALLFDTSSSMREGNHLKGRSVVDALSTVIDPKSDEAALFTFDQRLRQETPFTNNPDVIRDAASRTVAWGQTSLYDAVGDTAKKLADRPSPRQAVIVITDGVDTSSTQTASDVSRMASSVDVPVYVVAVAPRRRWFGIGGSSGLSSLARSTGGEQLGAVTPEEAATAVAALMTELRQQYFLAIEAAATPGWHRIEVRARQKNVKVRARSGYFAGTQ